MEPPYGGRCERARNASRLFVSLLCDKPHKTRYNIFSIRFDIRFDMSIGLELKLVLLDSHSMWRSAEYIFKQRGRMFR